MTELRGATSRRDAELRQLRGANAELAQQAALATTLATEVDGYKAQVRDLLAWFGLPLTATQACSVGSISAGGCACTHQAERKGTSACKLLGQASMNGVSLHAIHLQVAERERQAAQQASALHATLGRAEERLAAAQQQAAALPGLNAEAASLKAQV